MEEERLAKMLLFRELKNRDHAMGPRRGSVIEYHLLCEPLARIGDNWYSLAQDKSQWHKFCDKVIRSQRERTNDCAANNRSSYYL